MITRPQLRSRRALLEGSLFGAGLLGLRALATGLPAAVLARPREASGAPLPEAAQFLVFSSSEAGDPLNANVPGTYLAPDLNHPQTPQMTPTALSLSGERYTAAAPWAALPQAVLDRTCFFHHGTYTVVHPEQGRVLRLGDELARCDAGSTALRPEMLVSLLARHLAPALGCVQPEPISLGPQLTCDGRPQPVLRPSALGLLLSSPSGALGRLQRLRDADLDRLADLYRREGTQAQRDFVDRYATSQRQARELSQNLLEGLSKLSGDGPDMQARAAALLVAMKLSPAVAVRIPFGGDNHTDPGLAAESAGTVSGVATLALLQRSLAEVGVQDKTTFVALNVFGRTLANSEAGRQHHGDHHCAVLIGKRVRGSVVGGVEPWRGDYRAQSIDPVSGRGVPGDAGAIAFRSTLASLGKTVGRAAGADPALLESAIVLGGKATAGQLLPDGAVVSAALAV